MNPQEKHVHFCEHVEVYQPVLMGHAILKKKQVLNDQQVNPVLSFFQQKRIKSKQLLHLRHLARKRRRAERAHERLLQKPPTE